MRPVPCFVVVATCVVVVLSHALVYTVLHCNRPKSRDIAIRLLLNLPLDVFVIKLHLVDLVDSA